MTDERISELPSIAGANLADADLFEVVHSADSSNRQITRAELIAGLGFPRLIFDFDASNTASIDGGVNSMSTSGQTEVPTSWSALTITGATSGADTINGLNVLTVTAIAGVTAIIATGTILGRIDLIGVYKVNLTNATDGPLLCGDSAGKGGYIAPFQKWVTDHFEWALLAWDGVSGSPLVRTTGVTVATATTHCVGLAMRGAEARLFVDNVELTLAAKPAGWDAIFLANQNTNAPQAFTDNGFSSQNYDGLFAECQCFLDLADAERTSRTATLMAKWGL